MKIVTLSDLLIGAIMMLASELEGYSSAHFKAISSASCEQSAQSEASITAIDNSHITCAKAESAHFIKVVN